MDNKKTNEPMLPMMDFNEVPERKNTPLSFIDEEPMEERVPTNRPLRFDQDDELPTESPKPIEAPKPIQTPKPAEAPKPIQTPKPIEAPKPVETPKPAETPKPVETPKPTPRPNPFQPPRAYNQPKPAEPEDDGSPVPKTINLYVYNSAGVSLPHFSVNGKLIENGQQLTFRDERNVYDLTISADGFMDRRIQVTRADRRKGEKRVTLVSQAQRFTVSFKTPEGEKRGHIEVEQTSQIYEYFKEASHTDTPLNMLSINGVGGGMPSSPVKFPLKPFLIVFAVGFLLGIGIAALFSGGSDSKEDNAEQPELVATADNVQEAAPEEKKVEEKTIESLEPEKPVQEEEKKEEEKQEEEKAEAKQTLPERDIKYMKEAPGEIWKKDQMASDESRKLMSAFATGNIEFVISSSNAYNDVPSNQRNGYYNKLLKDLQRLKTQTNYEDVKKTMANECRSGNVNLIELLDKMHRMLK